MFVVLLILGILALIAPKFEPKLKDPICSKHEWVYNKDIKDFKCSNCGKTPT